MAGIAPTTLLAQVQNTAAWLFEPGFTQASYVAALIDGGTLVDHEGTPEARVAYLRMMLAAHYSTCCTLVPTDVDNRIRLHHWKLIRTREELIASIAAADEAALWPIPEVSDRWVEAGGERLSGHDGEWFSVYAAALIRAHELKMDNLQAQMEQRIEDSLARQTRILRMLVRTHGAELDALRAIALIAHNLGDLARVIEEWQPQHPWVQLPKKPMAPYGELFVRALDCYRDMMADENNRFLPLREARCLRVSRQLIVPLGPFFDTWGETVGRYQAFSAREHAEVLSALLAGHAETPKQVGYPRAISGLNRAVKGGVDRLESEISSRLRKVLRAGAVRPALDLDAHRFEERIRHRYTNTYARALKQAVQ